MSDRKIVINGFDLSVYALDLLIIVIDLTNIDVDLTLLSTSRPFQRDRSHFAS
jgi:hypothetical protein